MRIYHALSKHKKKSKRVILIQIFILLLIQVNTLNKEVIAEVESVLAEVQSNSLVNSAVLISGKQNNFIAGADISMLQTISDAESGYRLTKEAQRVLDIIANSKKPVVAAINGSCVGGGLEVTHFL